MEGALSLRRPAYLLLVLLVVASSIATYLARPRGGAPAGSCVPGLTLAIEVCPRADVEAILAAVAEGGPQRDDGRRLRLQTIADLALVAAYTALWSATGMALAPVAGLVAA